MQERVERSPPEIGCRPYRDTALQKRSAGKEQGPALRCPAGKGIAELAYRVGEEIDADPDIGEICKVCGDPLREGAFVACKDDHDIEIAPGNSPPLGKRSEEDDSSFAGTTFPSVRGGPTLRRVRRAASPSSRQSTRSSNCCRERPSCSAMMESSLSLISFFG